MAEQTKWTEKVKKKVQADVIKNEKENKLTKFTCNKITIFYMKYINHCLKLFLFA